MKFKMIATWGMIVVMLVTVVGTAAAQTGTETPTAAPTDGTVYTHPVVQILSKYFGRYQGPAVNPTASPSPEATVDPNATLDPNATVDPNATPTETPTATPDVPLTPEQLAEEIAMYHEEGVGFGVLVKLYAMAEASKEGCAPQVDPEATPEAPADGTPAADGTTDVVEPTCTVVTVADLVTEFQGGTGMGQLFKEYGKPALLGVGHVKNAMKHHTPASEETIVPTDEATITTDGTVTTTNKHGKPAKTQKAPKSKGHK
jgi:hypothetical protein